MPDKKFLEEFPLYKKLKLDFHEKSDGYDIATLKRLEKPAIHMYCDVCDSDQTFNMVNDYNENENNLYANNKIVRAKYICSACDKGERIFIIRFSTREEAVEGREGKNRYFNIEKIGQYPVWSIEMDKELSNILDEKIDLYKKGLTCESQSYGIGAYAYFRRILENIIDELLESIKNLIDDDKLEEYNNALESVKKERKTEEKIKLIKDLLPKSLMINGINPLNSIYSVISEGLHNETDEECMDKAEEIKIILIYLINQINKDKESKKSFTDNMKKILDKKSK